jgi:AraC-like DNA-binding protein
MDGSSWCILDAGQCSLAVAAGTQAIVVTLPELRQTSPHATVHSLARGVGRILLNLARSTLDEAADLDESTVSEIGNSLTELARLALRHEEGHQPRLPGRTILCERVKTFVRRHLHQSNLSIDYIARSFNCTKRHLHKVFGEGACSLNQFIWSLRLDRCAQDLASAELGDRSVTEIAFSWGFSNSSHFSRAFRQRFGMPPSAYRTALLGGTARLELEHEVRNHLAA